MSPLRSLVLVALLFGVPACGSSSSSPTAPTPVAGPISGTWTGTLAQAGAAQTLRLELTDSAFGTGWVVSGRYTATDAAGLATGTGSAGGIALNDFVSITLKPAAPQTCQSGPPLPVTPGEVLLTLTLAGPQMTGQAVTVSCAGESVGSVTLRR